MNATAATAAEIASYIEENDVSLESVASMAGTSPKRMSELQVAQCIPVHTYEVRCTHTFSSSFGDHAVGDDPQRYYHPSVLGGLKTALERADKLPLSEVAQRFRSDFEVAFDAALAGRTAPWPGGVNHAWAYLMDGTWGLCLAQISAVNLLRREFSRKDIRIFTELASERSLTSDERLALHEAVCAHDDVALPFAPHEVHQSSTCKEVAPAREVLAMHEGG